MNVLALCAGVGGLELGIKLATPRARCVCYVEGEAYAASIIVKRMEDEILDQAPIWSNVKTFDGVPWCGTVDCITGGYPCQPFSNAGKRKGRDDPRHLWPDIKRIIEEIRPGRCFFENVAGHLSLGFDEVANDLQTMGYEVAAGLFSAEEVGAPHRRERLFIMANTNCISTGSGRIKASDKKWGFANSCVSTTIPKWSTSKYRLATTNSSLAPFPPRPNQNDAWYDVLSRRKDLLPIIQPEIYGMVNGATNWMDRLRACGNGVVPLVAAYAWRTLSTVFTDRYTE